jgi:hypothetical protein
MRIINILFLSVVLTGCAPLRYSLSEKVIMKMDCVPISETTLPMIDVTVGSKPMAFILDTGSMGTAILDSAAIDSFKDMKLSSFGSNVSADKNKNKNRFTIVKMSSKLFESDNKLVLFSQRPSSKCSENRFMGLIGLDAFFEKGMAMEMNFSKNEICNIPISGMKEKVHEGSGFILLKSKCYQNQIFVYLLIEGREYKFKVDTGYSGNIILPYNEKQPFKNTNKIIIEGGMYITLSSFTTGTEIFYEKMPLHFAGEDMDGKVNVSTSIKAQNIGIGFIRCFDWLIDFQNNKVYVRRNNKKLENTFNRRITYYAKADDARLTILTKEISQTKYNLGDEIITVNGQKVTPENNCQMQDFLNKTEDWNNLQLEVKPVK